MNQERQRMKEKFEELGGKGVDFEDDMIIHVEKPKECTKKLKMKRVLQGCWTQNLGSVNSISVNRLNTPFK